MNHQKRHVILHTLCILLIAAVTGCNGVQQGSQPSAVSAAAPTASITTQVINKVTMEDVSFTSSRLEREMHMDVYLPGDYNANQKYAVLYLIHGFGCNEDSWRLMKLAEAAERVFQGGTVEPFIIAAPYIANSYAINSKDTTQSNGELNYGPYEDYFIQDVIGYVDSHYSTKTDREGRYIGGFSMGGYAALHLGMAYPSLFSKIGGHSPAALLRKDTRPDMYALLYATDEDKAQRNPMLLAKSADLTQMSIYLDCGTEDRLSDGTEQLYQILTENGVKAEYHAFSGDHTRGYWSSHIEEYLIFYGAK